MSYALVFLGGGIGAALRHGLNRAGLALLGPGFPWWTLAANVLGSFAIGLFAGWFAGGAAGASTRLFLTTGLLGGFTTFSAFSLDTLTLYQRGETTLALAYAGASVVLSLVACAAGLVAARAFA